MARLRLDEDKKALENLAEFVTSNATCREGVCCATLSASGRRGTVTLEVCCDVDGECFVELY
ncbi:MAG: hypothetical protein ACPL3C_07970 [Pyrobaculum sp.]